MAKTKYRQCELKQLNPTSFTRRVSWIPEKYAVVGKVLKLKDNGVWSDGWRVIYAGKELVDQLPPKVNLPSLPVESK